MQSHFFWPLVIDKLSSYQLCSCCMDLEKEDDNLDYGAYYSTDGDKWTDDTEVRGDLNRKKKKHFLSGIARIP